MAITTGQGIALGNLASPDRSKPFTNAVLNMQRLDLAREEKKARQQAAKQKQLDLLQKNLYFGEGGFAPHFQEQASNIIAQGVQGQMDATKNGDLIAQAQIGAQMKNSLEDLKVENDKYKNFVALKNQGVLIPQELENALGERYSTGNPKIRQYLKDNPQYNNIISIDENTGNYVYNPVKNLDLSKAFDTAIRENEGQMTQSKFLRGVDKNTSLYELSLSPEQLTNISAGMGANPEVLTNVKIKYPQKFNQYQQAAKSEFPELPDNQIESIAASKIIEEELIPRNRKTHFESRPTENNFNINLGLGGGSSNIPPSDQGAGVTIRRPTSVPNGEGGVVVKNADFNVPTGTPQGFKTVAIQNMRGDDFIALSNNRSLRGQPVQKVEVGQAIPMPVASKDLVDKTGKPIKKGELIDEARLQSALDNNAVEWVAMIPGQADLGDGIVESVVVPAQKVRRSVVISQAKDDAPLTDQSIQKAIDEANAKNAQLKYTVNQRGAIDAFRKQFQRDPNTGELQKILQKYK